MFGGTSEPGGAENKLNKHVRYYLYLKNIEVRGLYRWLKFSIAWRGGIVAPGYFLET